jgi:hypothetical protein
MPYWMSGMLRTKKRSFLWSILRKNSRLISSLIGGSAGSRSTLRDESDDDEMPGLCILDDVTQLPAAPKSVSPLASMAVHAGAMEEPPAAPKSVSPLAPMAVHAWSDGIAARRAQVRGPAPNNASSFGKHTPKSGVPDEGEDRRFPNELF